MKCLPTEALWSKLRSMASVSGLQSGDGIFLNVCHAQNLKQVFKIIISKRLSRKTIFQSSDHHMESSEVEHNSEN